MYRWYYLFLIELIDRLAARAIPMWQAFLVRARTVYDRCKFGNDAARGKFVCACVSFSVDKFPPCSRAEWREKVIYRSFLVKFVGFQSERSRKLAFRKERLLAPAINNSSRAIRARRITDEECLSHGIRARTNGFVRTITTLLSDKQNFNVLPWPG